MMPGRIGRRLRRSLQATYLRRRHGGVIRTLKSLERSQWLTPEEIRELQERRLVEILSHASLRVPFYREIFRTAGVDPSDGRAALAALPVMTKEMIRLEGPRLLSDDATARGAFSNSTGGSTGVPLTFTQDPGYEMHRRAAMYRGFGWCGWPLGGRTAFVWGQDPGGGNASWRGRLLNGLFGTLRYDAFALEEGELGRILDELEEADPDLLVGYASSLHLLARHALAGGGGPRLRAVQSSAEMLDGDAREDIERAFGCRVFDRYGCREAGVIAHECGGGAGWHINAESVLVETEPDGSLLVTTLMNRAMPLIRYRNEDLAELAGEAPCPCGRGLPRLKSVLGRKSDVIVAPSGRSIHGEFFTHLFYGAPGVRAFQVVQRGARELVIRVVADEAFGEEARNGITREIHGRADAEFDVRWEMVSRIPVLPSGKRRFTFREPAPGTAEGPS